MPIQRGDIYFVNLNPVKGREQAGQRPVLVLSIDAINPTATLLEHALLAQGFMGVSKVAFPRRLQPQNRDSTGANLSNAIKCRCRVNRRGQDLHLRPLACSASALLLSYSPMKYLIGVVLENLTFSTPPPRYSVVHSM